MPAANPFAPVIEVGGQATAGPASASASGALGMNPGAVGDHHGAAAILLLALATLIVLHRARFRFSQTVG